MKIYNLIILFHLIATIMIIVESLQTIYYIIIIQMDLDTQTAIIELTKLS